MTLDLYPANHSPSEVVTVCFLTKKEDIIIGEIIYVMFLILTDVDADSDDFVCSIW